MQEARQRLKMSDADIVDHFRRLGFIVPDRECQTKQAQVGQKSSGRLRRSECWPASGTRSGEDAQLAIAANTLDHAVECGVLSVD